MHPRDWGHPGRVKIELYDDMGNPKNTEILTKKVLMQKIVEVFPKLKSRVNQPALSVLDEARAKQNELVEKEKKDKQKLAVKGELNKGSAAKKAKKNKK